MSGLDDRETRAILERARRIAVVGLGANPMRPAFGVAAYLQRAGYEILPVHPVASSTLGVPVHRTLEEAAATGAVDIVNVFRRSAAVPELVAPCVAIRPALVWLQVGVRHDGAARDLEAAGIPVVQDRCIAVDHLHLLGR